MTLMGSDINERDWPVLKQVLTKCKGHIRSIL